MIINLPTNLEKQTTHRYGSNSFKLHRYRPALLARLAHVSRAAVLTPGPRRVLRARSGSLPVPRPGQVLGLVGTNGIGKSTALKILAGKDKPNLGNYENPPDWQEILAYFRGSELQNYFTRVLEDNLRVRAAPRCTRRHRRAGA